MSTRKESHPTLKLKKKIKILRFIFYFKKIPFLHTPPLFEIYAYVRTYVRTSQNRFLGRYNTISSTQFLRTGRSFFKSLIGLCVRKSYLFGKSLNIKAYNQQSQLNS